MEKTLRQSRFKKAAIALVVLISVLGAGLWVLSRESTLIWAVQHLEKRLDGRLSVAEVRGSLLSNIYARELLYDDKFGKLTVHDARMVWRPLRLLIGQVAVGAMSAKEVTLAIEKSDERMKPPESLSAPISFAITDFSIEKLSIALADATHEIHGLRAAFSGNRKQLKGEVKSFVSQWGTVKGELKVGAGNPFPLEGKWQLAAPEPRQNTLDAKLGGTLLNTEASIDAKDREANAQAKLAIAPFELQPLTYLEFKAKDLDPRLWAPTSPAAKLNAEGKLTTDAERKLTGAFTVDNSMPGRIDEKKLPFARAAATLQGTLKALALGDVKLDLAQAGQFAGDGVWRDGVLDVNLNTRNLNLKGVEQRLHKTNLGGKLALGGNAESQRVRFNLAQPPYTFRFAGVLSEGIAKIDEAYARSGNAEVTTRGRIALDAQKSFTVAGQLRNFDPSKFGAYPAHLINGRFDAKGHIQPVLQVAGNATVTDSRYAGLPATASGTFKSRRTDHPEVEMDATFRVGATRATAKGVVRDPMQKRSMDLQLTLAGASLDELYKIIGVPLPPTPAYTIKGRLVQSNQQWEFRQFAGTVGESDLAGNFLVDRARKPQFMKADLKSNRLVLADLAGFVGAEKTETGKVTTPNPSRVLPDRPYNLAKLKAADADIRFEGKRIVTESLPFDNMSTHLIVKGGVLTLSPLNFGVGGGKLVSDITLDGRASVIASRADIRVQSLQLSQILPKLKIAKASVGELDGRVRLSGRGNSIAAMLGTANGDTALVVGEGEVSDLMLRLSNLDIANTLLVLMRGDRNIPIRCMVADLAFENGVMHPRQFIFDTSHTTLVGEGRANFADETLDLRLVAKPRSKSLVSLRGPIVVRGTFADPSVMPDMKQLAARGAASIALGIVATPLAALLPLIQTGRGEDIQCGPLLQTARQAIQQPRKEIAAAR